MTDKPMKNSRKYVDSGFVHDMMENANDEHYFVRAHVWPSTKTDLLHNVAVVLSVISGAVIQASCEPCRASSLGRFSNVVAVLFSILDHIPGTKGKRGTKIRAGYPTLSIKASVSKVQRRSLILI